jgi:hypothetical protein
MDRHALRTQGVILLLVALGWFVWPIRGANSPTRGIERAMSQMTNSIATNEMPHLWTYEWSTTIGLLSVLAGIICLVLADFHRSKHN